MKKQKGTLTYRRVGPQPMVLEKWACLIHGADVHAGNKGGVLRSCLYTQGSGTPTLPVMLLSLHLLVGRHGHWGNLPPELLLQVFS